MAKFKAIFNFPLTFHAYEMPVVTLSSDPAYEELAALNKDHVQQILQQTGLFGYTAL